MSHPPAPALHAATLAAARCRVGAIEVERGGFGQATGLRLTLLHDGRATLVRTGQARHGTEDLVIEGRIAQRDFARLAARVHAAGFFALAEQYDDPATADGAWSRIAVRCLSAVGAGGVEHGVWWREGSGPAALPALAQALWRWQERRLPLR